VLWFDYRSNVIHVVRTNAAVTSFGSVLTLYPPRPLFTFQGLQAEGSAGRLDVLALATLTGGGGSPAYYDAQILPPLTLRASGSKVGAPGALTFTVLDAGDPVAGARMSFLGTTVVTNAKGVAGFAVKKGTKPGRHVATAGKPGYALATTVVTVK
jgi:hypothetical protein